MKIINEEKNQNKKKNKNILFIGHASENLYKKFVFWVIYHLATPPVGGPITVAIFFKKDNNNRRMNLMRDKDANLFSPIV